MLHDLCRKFGVGGVFVFGAGLVAATLVTRYLPYGFKDGLAPTSPVGLPVPRAGVFKNFHVRHNTPAGNGQLVSYTVRINGVPTLLKVDLASNVQAGSNIVNAVLVNGGDVLDIEITKGLAIGVSPADVCASLQFSR